MGYPAVLETLNVAAITIAIAVARDRLSVALLLTVSLISGLLIFLLATGLLLRVIRRPEGVISSRAAPLLTDIGPFWRGAAVAGLVGIGLGYADKLLVSLFLSFQLVSIFYIAERITFLLKRLLALPLQVASPEITRRWELGRRDELRRDVAFLIKIQFALGVLITSIIFVAAEAAVLVVSNSSFLAAAGLLRILTLSIVLMSFYAPITTLLRAIERIQLALFSDALWLGLYVALGVALMPSLGLKGIVLAQVAASGAAAVWNLAIGHRVARIAWDLGGLARVLGCGLVVAVPGYAVVRLAGARQPAIGLAVAALLLIAYNLLLVRSGALTAEDRRRFHDLTGRRRLARMLDLGLFWPAQLGRGR
jgi:O-antigen/teichoic acid export membrane protein